jgi:hypothetical protein
VVRDDCTCPPRPSMEMTPEEELVFLRKRVRDLEQQVRVLERGVEDPDGDS